MKTPYLMLDLFNIKLKGNIKIGVSYKRFSYNFQNYSMTDSLHGCLCESKSLSQSTSPSKLPIPSLCLPHFLDALIYLNWNWDHESTSNLGSHYLRNLKTWPLTLDVFYFLKVSHILGFFSSKIKN